MPRKPIEDYYGGEVKVQPLMASPGPMVDVEHEWTEHGKDGPVDCSQYFRLTPDQARELGKWLIEASGSGLWRFLYILDRRVAKGVIDDEDLEEARAALGIPDQYRSDGSEERG